MSLISDTVYERRHSKLFTMQLSCFVEHPVLEIQNTFSQ